MYVHYITQAEREANLITIILNKIVNDTLMCYPHFTTCTCMVEALYHKP